jgi:hypothetical protein
MCDLLVLCIKLSTNELIQIVFHVISGSITTAWRVLTLRLEERPPIWSVAANILNKQSRTSDKGWASRFGVVRGANKFSP